MPPIIKILGPKQKTYILGLRPAGGRNLVIVWPTNYGLLTLEGMSMISGIPIPTIYTRMGRYGETDPRVFSTEPLPKSRTGPNTVRGQKRKNLESITVGSWEQMNLKQQGRIT